MELKMLEMYRGKYDSLRIDRPGDRILRIAFNRPEHLNAVTPRVHKQIADIWRDIDSDATTNAVIVTGVGKAFSAGGDFTMLEEMAGNHAKVVEIWKEAKDLVYNMVNCSKPIISAINGPAAGAGLVVALLADISIAARGAKLVDAHPRLGVAAGDVGVLIWPLLCGLAKAKYYLLTCKPITGEVAERIGLVSMCVDEESLEAVALETAKELAEGSQSAVRWTKYALNNWLRAAGPIFDVSTALEMLGFLGPDIQEGIASHREKRRPRFDPMCPL